MRRLAFITAIFILFAACKKNDTLQPPTIDLLIGHKWYYHVFRQDGQQIPLNYCDTNNYLLFSDGGRAGIGNDQVACNGKAGIISTFSYIFVADSNIIHVKNFSGGDYTWQVQILTPNTFEILFTVPATPPAFAPNFDYTYTAK